LERDSGVLVYGLFYCPSRKEIKEAQRAQRVIALQKLSDFFAWVLFSWICHSRKETKET
tara:strand:- start:25925 stop:26101 length:177 start_codon:yes stop_codon:yes gene_type:complete